MQLDLHFVLKYFGVRPVVAIDERMQFQEIFKCLANKDDNGEWFLNFTPRCDLLRFLYNKD